MDTETVQELVQRAGAGLRLLDHPFYRRWERGELGVGELSAYAGQYRHFEQLVPVVLAGAMAGMAGMDDDRAVALIGRNLADEAGSHPTHLELFDLFAEAVNAPAPAATLPADTATANLVDTYLDLAAAGPAEGLVALAAYEQQAAEVAATKAAGLRAHYRLDGDAVLFWDVHAGLDADHAQWLAEAIARSPVEASPLYAAARRAARAWWSFLDQREAAADEACRSA